jgi:pimeloyl-ACP methyl ester carboxylesterase
VTPPNLSALLLSALAATAGAAVSLLASPPARAAPGALTLTPCQLEHPARITLLAAECGVLVLSEDPSEPAGRHIEVHVAKVPAINRRKRADPLFVLAGGPGMAATTFYSTVAPAFDRIHRDRDIVLVDQRGTGHSNALSCELSDDLIAQDTEAQIVAEAQRCLREASAHADVRFYTTSVAVLDLERVRAALGYERIDLYGSSYGTRVAQHYIRRFPDRVRSVILDGIVPPQTALGPAIALDAERALRSILARCARDSECRGHFGDPTVDYQKLRAQLKAQPVPVTLPDPTTGEASRLELTPFHLAMVLRIASYSPQEAALLPLILHGAGQGGDFRPLATQFLLMNRAVGEELAYGMHNSVVCSEDVPFFDVRAIDRALLEQTFLGTAPVDGLRSVCQLWPRGPIDADFHAPLHSDVPALLLSGSDDPVTPPAYGEQARQGFTHALHVVMQGFGHGQLIAPCMDRVMARFLDLGAVDALDTSCTRHAKPMPFFTSLNGPAP